MSVPATGTWPGQASVAASFFAAPHMFPGEGPVQLRVEDGRLYLGSASMTCVWEAGEVLLIPVPVDATFEDLLRVP